MAVREIIYKEKNIINLYFRVGDSDNEDEINDQFEVHNSLPRKQSISSTQKVN